MLVNKEGLNPNEATYLANMFAISAAEKRVDRDILILDMEALKKRAVTSNRQWISPRIVNKAISEKIFEVWKSKLVARSQRKYVSVSKRAPFYLALYKDMNVQLSKVQKKEFYNWLEVLSDKITEDLFDANESFALSSILYFKVDALHAKWVKLLDEYSEDRSKSVTIDPDIMGGTPVVAGTRIPVYSLEARIDAGEKVSDIKQDYPHLGLKTIRAAIAFARTHPRQGRPKKVANKIR